MVAVPVERLPYPSEEEVVQQLKGTIEEAFRGRFQEIEFHEQQGTTRFVFIGTQHIPGTQRSEQRIIKVDKPDFLIDSPRSIRHTQRGYNTLAEAVTHADLPEAEDHHIIRSESVRDLSAFGWDGVATVERFYAGSQSLEALVEEQNEKIAEKIRKSETITRKDYGLSASKVGTLFSDVLDAMVYMKSEGFYHRDLKPSNILAGRGMRGKVIDLANAGKIGELEEKVDPTGGGRCIYDPLQWAGYVKDTPIYNEQAEMYAFGVDLLFALTGKHWIHYDPENKVAKRLDTGESLLDERGLPDPKKHEVALEAALKTLKGSKRKYRKVIRQCMTLKNQNKWMGGDSEKLNRYEDLSQLKYGWEIATAGSVSEWLKHRGEVLLAGGCILGLMALLGTSMSFEYYKELAQLRTTAGMHQVANDFLEQRAWWNNTIFDTDITAENWRMRGSEEWPEDGFVRARPGDAIHIDINPTKRARFGKETYESIWSLDAHVYIEGWPATETVIQPYNAGHTLRGRGQGMNNWVSLDIPEDIPPGTYRIILEVPTVTDPEDREEFEERFKIRFPEKGVIHREPIDLVIGDEVSDLDLKDLEFSSGGYHFDFGDPMGKRERRDIMYEIRVPELGVMYTDEAGNNYARATTWELPLKTDVESVYTMQIVGRDAETGRVVTEAFLPIHPLELSAQALLSLAETQGHRDYCTWEETLPDAQWHERLIEYRKQAMEGLPPKGELPPRPTATPVESVSESGRTYIPHVAQALEKFSH